MAQPVTDGEPRPLRVLIAGGGTGGHLFPGIALAERVCAVGGEVLFVGTERGIEARVVPDEGFALELIEVTGIKGRGLGGLVRGLARLPRAAVQSRRIIRAFRPDVVVGVGGYASGPLVATAALMGRPTALLEQNSIPGITNRILGRMVRRIYCAFEDRAGRFPARKVALVGNPIRAGILARLQQVERAPEDGRPPRLLVLGGSQGARALNEAMMAMAPLLRDRLPTLEIWHQSGATDEDRVRAAFDAAGLAEPRARVSAFVRDMAEPYGWCDLILSRAGATSLAEFAAAGRPAVLVPFPHAADNHQEWNARDLVQKGAAVMVIQSELVPESLAGTLVDVLGDRDRLADMAVAMRSVARPEAASAIYGGLVELAGGAVP